MFLRGERESEVRRSDSDWWLKLVYGVHFAHFEYLSSNTKAWEMCINLYHFKIISDTSNMHVFLTCVVVLIFLFLFPLLSLFFCEPSVIRLSLIFPGHTLS